MNVLAPDKFKADMNKLFDKHGNGDTASEIILSQWVVCFACGIMTAAAGREQAIEALSDTISKCSMMVHEIEKQSEQQK